MTETHYVLVAQRYPCEATAVRRARELAVRAYAPYPWVDRELVRLLVSETVTNAVLHSGGREFDLICHAPERPRVRIEVHDRSRVRPARQGHRVLDSHGRGLELLDLLAPGWGIAHTLHGKSLIFTLASE